MTYAFGHLVAAWLAGKGYELISKKTISHYTWFFLLLGGILPDADFIIDWLFKTHIHRTFTHSLLFVIVASLIVYLVSYLLKKEQAKSWTLALGIGILIHLTIDFISPQGLPLLWPYSVYISPERIGAYSYELSLRTGTADYLKQEMNLAILDMGVGVSWIFYLWFKKRIKF